MSILMIDRHAALGNQLIQESHIFVSAPGGFSLEGQSGTWKVLSSGNELYEVPADPKVSPYSLPLKEGVVLKTKQEYDALHAAQLEQMRLAAEALYASEPQQVVRVYSDSDKIFLIDYNGTGVKNNADKRRHFKLLYGFDPVDEDPRNG